MTTYYPAAPAISNANADSSHGLVNAFGDAPPSPLLSRQLLDMAKQRKKAGRHILIGSTSTSSQTQNTRRLILSAPVGEDSNNHTLPEDVLQSMLDQARLSKRKGLHHLSEDGTRLILTSSSSNASASTNGGASSASSTTRTYFSCASVL